MIPEFKLIRVLAKIVVLSCIVLTACTEKNATSIAERLQNGQVIQIPGIGEINTISSEENDLILETNASARYLNYDVIKKEDSKAMIGDNAVVAIFKLGVGDDVMDANVGLVFRFRWDDGRHVDVKFSPSELKARAHALSAKRGHY